MSMNIIKRLNDYGIDPFNYKTTPGIFVTEFKKVLTNDFLEKYKEESLNIKKDCSDFKNLLNYSELEYINVYRFDKDFLKYRTESLLEHFMNTAIFKQALDKLVVLHSCNIFHLDIKPENLAIDVVEENTYRGPVNSTYIYFNDWDLALISKSKKEEEDKFKFVNDNKKYYFESLFENLKNEINYKEDDIAVEIRALVSEFTITKREFLMLTDCFNLACSFPKIFEGQNVEFLMNFLKEYIVSTRPTAESGQKKSKYN